jgi:hypothetical protein
VSVTGTATSAPSSVARTGSPECATTVHPSAGPGGGLPPGAEGRSSSVTGIHAERLADPVEHGRHGVLAAQHAAGRWLVSTS